MASNPSGVTVNILANQGIKQKSVAFSFLKKWISDTFNIRLIMGVTATKLRFVPARLVIPESSSKDQRWYIRYQAFSVPDGKIRPFKVYLINDYRNHPNFSVIVEELCREINFRLTHGAVFDPESLGAQKVLEPEKAKKRESEEPTMLSVLNIVLQSKAIFKDNTFLTYRKILLRFESYLKSQNRLQILVKDWKYTDSMNYSMFLIQALGLAPRTHNNHINALKTLWNDLKTMEIVDNNPWEKVRKPSSGTGRNVAFNLEQQKQLMQYMNEHYPRIGFMCRFVYYTGCRTVELANLTIGDLFQAGKDKIHIDRRWAKNSNMRQVVIHPALEKELLEMDLKRFPPDYYLFSRSLLPGKKKLYTQHLADRFREKVLTPLGYSKEYTLYSWRHTFAVMGYLNGMTVAELGMQLGHLDPGSTNTYLKSLGLFENDAVKTKLPGLNF